METIIAGRFETFEIAEEVKTELIQFIDVADICIFYNNPPGQHDVLIGGGDEIKDPESEDALGHGLATSASAGAVAGTVGMLGGPIVALAAAGVAAYTGSLVGAMHGMANTDQSSRRQSGIILAVRLAKPEDKERVESTLNANGAEDIELAEGKWRNGDWVDFNPLETPNMQ